MSPRKPSSTRLPSRRSPDPAPGASRGDSADLARALKQAVDPLGRARGAEVFPLVYGELRRLANARGHEEREGHALQPTARVHEAFVRLVPSKQEWTSARRFYGAASEAMRRILVDHARKLRSERRGGEWLRIPFEDTELKLDGPDADRLIDLDDALERLSELDARAAEFARLHLFGGLEVEEIARTLDLSPSTAFREWQYVRARLSRLLEDGGGRDA